MAQPVRQWRVAEIAVRQESFITPQVYPLGVYVQRRHGLSQARVPSRHAGTLVVAALRSALVGCSTTRDDAGASPTALTPPPTAPPRRPTDRPAEASTTDHRSPLAGATQPLEVEPGRFDRDRALGHVSPRRPDRPAAGHGTGVPQGGGVRRAPARAAGYDVSPQRSPCPPATRGACRWRPATSTTWSPAAGPRPGHAVPPRGRPPRHRAAGARRGGQRPRRRGAARAGPAGADRGHPGAGRVRRVRRRGAARARRRPAPLRVVRLRTAADRAERRGAAAMVSLDRVGVGGRCPVCTGGRQPAAGARRPARRGPAARHPDRLVARTGQRPLAVREGRGDGGAGRRHDYAGYHSAGDVRRRSSAAQRRPGRARASPGALASGRR